MSSRSELVVKNVIGPNLFPEILTSSSPKASLPSLKDEFVIFICDLVVGVGSSQMLGRLVQMLSSS